MMQQYEFITMIKLLKQNGLANQPSEAKSKIPPTTTKQHILCLNILGFIKSYFSKRRIITTGIIGAILVGAILFLRYLKKNRRRIEDGLYIFGLLMTRIPYCIS